MRRRQLMLAGMAAAPLAGVAPARAEAGDANPMVRWPAITLLDGRTLAPASWQGRPAVVVFWATWCPFCKRHNAHVDTLYRQTLGQGLRVLALAADRDADAVRRHMAIQGHAFPVALDDGTLRQRLSARRVLPLTCVLDRQGRLLQAIPGEMAEDDVLGLARVLHRPAA